MQSVGQTISRHLLELLPQRIFMWKKQIEHVRGFYRLELNRDLNLMRPTRFSEKIQWKKLFDGSKIYKTLSDKIAVRTYVAEKGFASLLVPQLWVGTDPALIPFDSLPRPFVLKSTHASGHVIIVHNDQEVDAEQIVRETQGWLAHCHGTHLREPGYIGIPRQLVVEQLLVCSNGEPPTELKVFVFDGVARIVHYITITRQRQHRAAYFDRHWNQYPWTGRMPPLQNLEKPSTFDQAIEAAEALSGGMELCRVDFYLKDDSLYFGEITLYPYSGVVRLQPDEADFTMGSFWKLRWPNTRAIIAMVSRDWGEL